jgi:hypothetical protein
MAEVPASSLPLATSAETTDAAISIVGGIVKRMPLSIAPVSDPVAQALAAESVALGTQVAAAQAAAAQAAASAASAIPAAGGVAVGPIIQQSSQTVASGGAELARLDTVDAKIAAALAAYAGGTVLSVTTFPVIRVQGGGSPQVGSVFEIQTAAAWSTTPDVGPTRAWKANGAAPAGSATGTTYTALAADVGKTITLVYSANMTGKPVVTAPSNGIQVLSPGVPVLITPPALVESPSGTFTITPGVWDVAVAQAYQVYVGGLLVKQGAGANSYVSALPDVGKQIFIRTLPSYSGQQLPAVDTPIMVISGTWYVPTPGLQWPTASPAPDTPGAITVTDLGNGSWGLTTTFDNSPAGIIHWYWNTSSSGTQLTDNYIGASPGDEPAILFTSANSAVYVRADAENSTGYSGLTAYVQLAAQSPPATINPLLWTDTRVKYWIRTSKTNAEVLAHTSDAARFGPGTWLGGQMANEVSFAAMGDTVTAPDPSNGNVQRLIFGRGAVGTPDEGYFKHHIWNGMPPWDGGGGDLRLRSSIQGPVPGSAPPATGPYILGQEYWHAWGYLLKSDMFASASNSPDYFCGIGGGYHHIGGGGGGTSQVPWSNFCGLDGYESNMKYNGAESGLDSAPTGFTGVTNDKDYNSAIQNWKVVLAAASRAQCENVPHFFVAKFRYHWNYNANPKPYITVWRQIGVDGAIVQLGSWTIPTCYREDAYESRCTPNLQVLHYWHPSLLGGTSRSIYRPGAMIVQDPGNTVTVQQMFDSLTADIPRVGGGGGGGSSSTIVVDFTTAKKQVSVAPSTTDTQTHTSNFTAGRTAVLTVSHYQAQGNRITGVTIGGTAATPDTQTPGPTGQFTFETWRATNMAGGTANIEVTTGGGSSNHIMSYAVTQVQALSLTPVDTPTKAYGSGSSAAPSISMGSTGAQANEIAFAGFVHATDINSAITPPSGWTAAWEEEDGTTKMPGGCAYKILSSTAVDTATWATADSVAWYSSIVTYKAA